MRDQRTTPDVVRISNVSNIVCGCEQNAEKLQVVVNAGKHVRGYDGPPSNRNAEVQQLTASCDLKAAEIHHKHGNLARTSRF